MPEVTVTEREIESLETWSFVRDYNRDPEFYSQIVGTAFHTLLASLRGHVPEQSDVAIGVKAYLGLRDGHFDKIRRRKNWFRPELRDTFLDIYVRFVVAQSWKEIVGE